MPKALKDLAKMDGQEPGVCGTERAGVGGRRC